MEISWDKSQEMPVRPGSEEAIVTPGSSLSRRMGLSCVEGCMGGDGVHTVSMEKSKSLATKMTWTRQ